MLQLLSQARRTSFQAFSWRAHPVQLEADFRAAGAVSATNWRIFFFAFALVDSKKKNIEVFLILFFLKIIWNIFGDKTIPGTKPL